MGLTPGGSPVIGFPPIVMLPETLTRLASGAPHPVKPTKKASGSTRNKFKQNRIGEAPEARGSRGNREPLEGNETVAMSTNQGRLATSPPLHVPIA